jgi:hypothetical protein
LTKKLIAQVQSSTYELCGARLQRSSGRLEKVLIREVPVYVEVFNELTLHFQGLAKEPVDSHAFSSSFLLSRALMSKQLK